MPISGARLGESFATIITIVLLLSCVHWKMPFQVRTVLKSFEAILADKARHFWVSSNKFLEQNIELIMIYLHVK